ncbi:MAG TPA: hypothetical protein DCM28_24005 [Phycisphaerales bacterium]|nr:hypothetical protein [Phycisphaerales bacterium]HCD31824.1 hypothetical protein [Phycisphaerales bacterium]|tara:strand:- start:2020 stop:2346 length:327 start_codon:yes stop_codon:yes gene_type:complete
MIQNNSTKIVLPGQRLSFPREDVIVLIRTEMLDLEDENVILQDDRGVWEPSIDSLDLVSVVLKIEELLECKLPPENIIRRGGYASVAEGVEDMASKIEAKWYKLQKSK